MDHTYLPVHCTPVVLFTTQTVAVLMKNKERAADIGKAERRVLQPQVARKMARMNVTKKADFEKKVQQEVERVVYAAKRRYVRRQEKLDQAGVFHPEANAHRCVYAGTQHVPGS